MSRRQWLILQVFLSLMLMMIAAIRNIFFDHFPVNNAPVSIDLVNVLVIFSCLSYGLKLWNPLGWDIRTYLNGLSSLFLFYSLIIMGSYFIQFTPFQTIDNDLIRLDAYFSFDLSSVVKYMMSYDNLVVCMHWVYDSLWFEVVMVPLVLIILSRYDLLLELYSLTLISCIIGFTFYYLFPTTAPASVFGGECFLPEQHATGVKFYELHHYISPSTNEGGLISFPSFHVIYAWLMVYILRDWNKIYWILAVWNTCIAISCVLLGWHYLFDVIGSAIVLVISFGLERLFVYDKKYSSWR